MRIKAMSLVGLLPLLTSCALTPLALPPVGPGPGAPLASSPPKGDLQVFSQTQEYYDDDLSYFPHTDYQIYNMDGKRLKLVWNHQNHEDETPTTVTLSPGDYVVKAWAESYGLVSVPVRIKPNRTTVVILQPGWKPGNPASTNLVRMPNGYFVGWSANLGEHQ